MVLLLAVALAFSTGCAYDRDKNEKASEKSGKKTTIQSKSSQKNGKSKTRSSAMKKKTSSGKKQHTGLIHSKSSKSKKAKKRTNKE